MAGPDAMGAFGSGQITIPRWDHTLAILVAGLASAVVATHSHAAATSATHIDTAATAAAHGDTAAHVSADVDIAAGISGVVGDGITAEDFRKDLLDEAID